jgi:hypothetical protein
MTERASSLAFWVIMLPALWLGGFLMHADYIDQRDRQPAQRIWSEEEASGDLVSATKAMHAREVAECRMGDPLYFWPFSGRCDDWEKSFAKYDAQATPESIRRDREMVERAIVEGARQQ